MKTNLSLFEPTEKDYLEHIRQMKNNIEFCIHEIEELENAEEFQEQLDRFIKSNDKQEKIKLMQDFQFETLEAFYDVNPADYLNEKDCLFMYKVLGIEAKYVKTP